MIDKIKQYFRDNKTTYLLRFAVKSATTGQEAFDTYNALVPSHLEVSETSFQSKDRRIYVDNHWIHRIECWVWVDKRKHRKEILNIMYQYSDLLFLSDGKSKRKHKHLMRWGIE